MLQVVSAKLKLQCVALHYAIRDRTQMHALILYICILIMLRRPVVPAGYMGSGAYITRLCAQNMTTMGQ